MRLRQAIVGALVLASALVIDAAALRNIAARGAVTMQASASVAVPVPPPPVSSAASSSASAVDALTARLNDKYQRSAVIDFGKSQFVGVSGRLSAFTAAYVRVRQKWNAEGDAEAGDAEAGGSRGDALRAEIAALGPVAVKVGQTLSQRPDILPKDVCEALKTLQTGNTPFADADAWRVIADETGWDGPIAPGLAPPGCARPDGAPLFAKLSASPIAAASLGQVYRGTLADGGVEVAVKVQRPDARRQILLDAAAIYAVCALTERAGLVGDIDLLKILDLVFSEVVRELDFTNEATNAAAFERSLAHLGYATVPQVVPGLVTDKWIVTEWVYGRHLDQLDKEEALRYSAMSVEAVTAGLVCTGLVHADPHEGNIMLADDGRIVFLDFGLMSTVPDAMMDAFALGIQAVINSDWPGLTQAFIRTGFVETPIKWRPEAGAPFVVQEEWEENLTEKLTAELKERMEAEPTGLSQFGALSTVLFAMGKRWQMRTPPYIILLIRTFLTLEGVVGQIDEKFNVYTAALPWAIQRALSPSTDESAAALRSNLLDGNNELRWEKLVDLASKGAEAAPAAEAEAAAAEEEEPPAAEPAAAAAAAAGTVPGTQSPLQSAQTVLASTDGAELRRIARDVDSTELLLQLASPAARKARRLAVAALAAAIAAPPAEAAVAWPTSSESAALDRRSSGRMAKVTSLLVRSHLQRQLAAGWRGAAALCALAWIVARVGVAAVAKSVFDTLGAQLRRLPRVRRLRG